MKTYREPLLPNISTENVPPCWVPVSVQDAVTRHNYPPPLNISELISHIYRINCVRSFAAVAVFFFAPALPITLPLQM